MPYFSIIIPVYNRPDEVDELLESLTLQTYSDFEVLLIEDGSSLKCDLIAQKYEGELNVRYYFKENSGRSETRNYGMERAEGEYFVFFDSDCVIPPFYFEKIKNRLAENYTDSYGGPDKADESFSDLQKAISFSMTSFLTTGGIRGSKGAKMEKFVPRTFNMGFSKEVYQTVGGFKDMFGEDIDLSLRIRSKGYTCQLISDAFVYHKRRVSLRSFYRQVHVFGMARISLYLLHPSSMKLVHTLPALFTIASVIILFLAPFIPWLTVPLVAYFLLIFVVSSIQYKKVSIGLLSIVTSAIQLYGYGWGFMKSYVKKVLIGKKNSEKEELNKYYNKK
ncbi:MAG: glycosyltransferase [Dysgonamonadaceae bacterium]|nr:glycosyltransferase [Dysgonamonadaceae bacterium]MDD3355828.1 glycosyltransferase [Dysgonamonadaceae bacterium]MDD3727162.1 glycosyltransferase [Dysgonamonadaceae bacterium]MDD4605685.1 glycosyltransferase [Dysgonamonadaceae bacterium]